MATEPIPRSTKVEDEARIVIHTVCRDLLRILSRREKISMGKIVWNALSQYWLQQGYDPRLLFHVMDPQCSECGRNYNNPTEQHREALVERLSGKEWKEYEKNFIEEQNEMERLANEAGLEHPGDCQQMRA